MQSLANQRICILQLDLTQSSVGSDDQHPSLDDEQIALKKRLKNQKFLGTFHAKKYVPSLQQYRDLITVDAQSPENFINQLEYVKDKLIQKHNKMLRNPVWIGATVTAESQPFVWTIWTQLPDGTPFGAYRFKVKTVRFLNNEIIIKVRIMDEPNESIQSESDTIDLQMSRERFLIVCQVVWSDMCLKSGQAHEWIKNRDYSLANSYEVCKYVVSFLVLMFWLTVNGIGWLGHLSLLLLVETRKWVTVLMPLFLKLVDLANNVIGGLFILISMMWRDIFNGLFNNGPNQTRTIVHRSRPSHYDDRRPF